MSQRLGLPFGFEIDPFDDAMGRLGPAGVLHGCGSSGDAIADCRLQKSGVGNY